MMLHTVVLVVLSATLSAHPGHGEVELLTGTVTAIEAARIQLEVFDRNAFRTARRWVIVDEKTKVQSGKTRVGLGELRVGQDIDCMAENEEGEDGGEGAGGYQVW